MYNTEKMIRVVVNTFKIVSLIIVIMGIIDLAIDKKLIVANYTFAHDSNYSNMVLKLLCLYLYIGHSLYNAELFLMTFGINYAYNDIFLHNHKQNKWNI